MSRQVKNLDVHFSSNIASLRERSEAYSLWRVLRSPARTAPTLCSVNWTSPVPGGKVQESVVQRSPSATPSTNIFEVFFQHGPRKTAGFVISGEQMPHRHTSAVLFPPGYLSSGRPLASHRFGMRACRDTWGQECRRLRFRRAPPSRLQVQGLNLHSPWDFPNAACHFRLGSDGDDVT